MLYGNWTQFLHRAPSYSGTVIEGSETPEEAGKRFYRMVIEVAPGTLARSETRYDTEPIDMSLQVLRF
jgi:altronate dehydratase